MTSKEWAVMAFFVSSISTADSVLTGIVGITILNPVYGNFTAMEMRLSALISFFGGLILWYLPKQPKE